MPDPPGKVLLSLTPGYEKRNLKLWGFSSMFFQIFDWNLRLSGKRLLAHKLLPAGRRAKHRVRSPKDEKLPMAKLLLIANENRGGFPKVVTCNAQVVLNKGNKTPEKKKSKQSPSVVAKLMGLETMPSPEPCKDKKQQALEDTTPIVRDDAPSTEESCGDGRVVAPDTANAKPYRRLACYKSDNPKISFFCKLPALSPRKAESALRAILSPSKTHNKLLSPIKSPLATKRGARLLEAAAKYLEPNMQPSARKRGLGINFQVAARTLLTSNARAEEGKHGYSAPRPHKKPPMPKESKEPQQSASLCVYSDQSKLAQGKLEPGERSSNIQDTNSVCKSQTLLNGKRGRSGSWNQAGSRRSGSLKEENASHAGPSAGRPRLICSKGVKEPEHGKSSFVCNNELKNGKEKGKPEVARQKQSLSRLSQSRGGAKKMELGPRSTNQNMHDIENLDPNISTLAAIKGEDCDSLSADSVVSSNSGSILNYGKLFSSGQLLGTTPEAAKKTQKKGESSAVKSVLRKKGVAMDSLTKSSRSRSVKMDNSQVSVGCEVDDSDTASSKAHTGESHLNSSFKCITKVSLDDNSLEGESALASCLLMEVSEVCMKSTRNESALWQPSPKGREAASSLVRCNTLVYSNVATLRAPTQSHLSSAEELHDSASSSYAHLELSGHRKKNAVSYSGKSTAAILQELLMALNSTKTKTASEDSIVDMAESCESSSKLTLYPQLGEDCDDFASSASVLTDDLRKSPLASTRYRPCNYERRQLSSPVSTLEFLSMDNSSTFSDDVDAAQEQRVCASNCHEIISKRHHTRFPTCVVHVKDCKKSFECEEQYVKDIVKSAKLSPVDVYTAKLQLSCTILNPIVFNNLEEQFYKQWEWGIRPHKNTYAHYGPETDLWFTSSLYVEACIQNRKLLFECVNEALNMHLGINEHHSRQNPLQSGCASYEVHISQSVCRQMGVWGGMACCMNIDDIVEQEMNTGFGKWAEFVDEVSDFAVEMECDIVRGLVDEMVMDSTRRSPAVLGNRKKAFSNGTLGMK